MLEYLTLRMVYKVESRLGIDRNSDQYTVLNWMKSGIESLYIIILTQFIPLFSLFFSYFSIFFFFFKPSGRTSSIFPRPHQAISRCERKLLRSICSCSGRSTCVALLNSFSRIREREKRERDRMKSRSILETFFEMFEKQRDSKKFEFSLNCRSYYIYEDRLIS